MTTAVVIREAVEADIPELIEMGLRFHAQSSYAGFIQADIAAMSAVLARMFENADSAVFVAVGDGSVIGMIGLCVYPHQFDGALSATEFFFWVEPKARGVRTARDLLRTAEQWAHGRGAVRIQMIAPDDRVGAWYTRFGYRRVEVTYQKGLTA